MTSAVRVFAAILVIAVVLGFLAFSLYIIPTSQIAAINKDMITSETRKQELLAERARLEVLITALNDTLAKQAAYLEQNNASAQPPAAVDMIANPQPQVLPQPTPVITRAS